MKDKIFIDTNIFVYSFDSGAPIKKEKSQELIHQALSSEKGCISYQVIQEFLSLSTKRFKSVLPPEKAKEYYRKYLNPMLEIYPSQQLYFTGLDIARDTNYGFYDSLIISAAIEAGAKKLYSEDLHHGQVISGVKIINPFVIENK